MLGQAIHIIHGDSAAGCLEQALRPASGDILVAYDDLSCGPLPGLDPLDSWRRVREQYWRSIIPGLTDASFGQLERDLLTSTFALADAESIVLWVGTGLADQLLLAWTVRLLRVLEIDPAKLRVIQFVRDSGSGLEVWSLGLLNPDQVRAHPPPVPLGADALVELEEAWAAVTAGEPTSLLTFLSRTARSLPFLQPALKKLLTRFPHVQSGVNYWERELLKCTRDRGPLAPRIVAYTMGDNFGPDLIGDAYLFSRLRRLADTSHAHPLLNLSGDRAALRRTEVRLTDAGHEVLAGRASFIALNGIDDWVGGVHLDSTRRLVWFHSGDSLIPVSI